jgi:hypothetical protein
MLPLRLVQFSLAHLYLGGYVSSEFQIAAYYAHKNMPIIAGAL